MPNESSIPKKLILQFRKNLVILQMNNSHPRATLFRITLYFDKSLIRFCELVFHP